MRRPFLKRLPALAADALAVMFFLLAAFHVVLGRLPDPLESGSGWDWTVRLTDRNGELLREYLSPSLTRKSLTPLPSFSGHLVNAVLAAEDKRFFSHPGADPLALARAAADDVRAGRIVSGGSTLTMQLARLSMGLSPGPRTFARKMKETLIAFLIERRHTKEEILEAYLNLAPTGGGTEGFAAASMRFLGKPPSSLSPAEAALLAGLPASPERYSPFRHPERALKRRDVVLARMLQAGTITEEEHARALEEPVRLSREPPPFLAPHFAARAREQFPDEPPETVRTTLDLALQLEIEAMARDTVERYREQGLEQVSVAVMTLPGREVLAWVGSADFHNPRDGQLDGVTAPRQPGSALKPFIYAMGFEEGVLAPSSLMADEPSDFPGWNGVFSPRNYSGSFSAPVSARTALGSSLNIPAVNLTNSLGVSKVLSKLRDLGLATLDRDHDFYGLGISLGGGEVSLIDLLTAYASLADSGVWKPAAIFLEPGFEPFRDLRPDSGPGRPVPRVRRGVSPARAGTASPGGASPAPAASRASAPSPESPSSGASGGSAPTASLDFPGASPARASARRVFSPEAAFMVTSVLSDARARVLGFGEGGVLDTPYPSAVKTGTSTSFRDNFCLGFTDRHAVGVWAGNFQARPMARISGVTGAGELWRRVMDRLAERGEPGPLPPAPPGVVEVRVCPVSGLPAGPDCPNTVRDYFPANRPLPRECDHDAMDLSAVPVIGRELRFRLLRPATREIYALDPEAPPAASRVRALVQSVPGVTELEFILNGRPVGRRRVDGYARASLSIPLARGENLLEVVGLRGSAAPLRDSARYTVR
ncbi:MAG: transglycosylase domain-containing protein [Deltaproteobacteria bacterium]|jgi:penicillin-binding protein 1C|nr:transglycosylase domain-containing protein [Deltaproteobacteria bacterium]